MPSVLQEENESETETILFLLEAVRRDMLSMGAETIDTF